MKNISRNVFILLALCMIVGLMPWMAADARADDSKITTNITYAGLSSSDVTFTLSRNGESFELKDGETQSVGDISGVGEQFTIICSSSLKQSRVFYSGTWGMSIHGEPSFNTNNSNGCTFEWNSMYGDLTLNISVSSNFTGYTVHFDPNTKDCGTGTMANQAIATGVATALSDCTFTNTFGKKFAGWSTTVDGSVKYTNGESVTNLANAGDTITLYAVWGGGTSGGTYTVHFDKNVPGSDTMADQTFQNGETKQLSKCTFTPHNGSTFLGWSRTWDGSVEYTDEQSVCNLTTSAEITLYAQWESSSVDIMKGHTIRFNANGGTGTMSDQEFQRNHQGQLCANAFTRDGYSFTGWNTSADGSGTGYTDQQNINPDANMTLYAQWSLKNSTHYAVRFNANGGSGTMFDQAIAVGESAALTTCAFTRTGYSFAGWTTEADGSGATTYTDGATVSGMASAGQTVNLYAQWTQNNYNM